MGKLTWMGKVLVMWINGEADVGGKGIGVFREYMRELGGWGLGD